MIAPIIMLAVAFIVTFPAYAFIIMRQTHKYLYSAQKRVLYAVKMAVIFASIADTVVGLVTYLIDIPSGILTAGVALFFGSIALAGFIN